MRAVIQLVDKASVTVDDRIVGAIGKGLLVLLAIEKDDNDSDLTWLADKVINLRIFADTQDKMNLSINDVNGEMLIVSQFTLMGDCRKGRRPSYDQSAAPDEARHWYEKFIVYCRQKGQKVENGEFQAKMIVDLVNHGPVTIMLDSRKTF